MCSNLTEYLRKSGRTVIRLDGDKLRQVLDSTRGHSREDRRDLAMRYARLCRLLAGQGVDVTIATISLFKEVHNWNRENLPNYHEIYLDVPLDELKRRDPKNIYKRAMANELSNVAGVDLEVDFPEKPDVVIRHENGKGSDDSFQELVEKLKL